MLCEMPVLNLPTEFTRTNDTRREGTAVSTLRTPNATLNMYIGFTLDNLPTFKNLSKVRPGISFTLNPLQVSFAAAGDTPVEFDPSVNKYLRIEVCVSDALPAINNRRQSGYVCFRFRVCSLVYPGLYLTGAGGLTPRKRYLTPPSLRKFCRTSLGVDSTPPLRTP